MQTKLPQLSIIENVKSVTKYYASNIDLDPKKYSDLDWTSNKYSHSDWTLTKYLGLD